MLSRINTVFILGMLSAAASIRSAVTAQPNGVANFNFDFTPDFPLTSYTNTSIYSAQITNNDFYIDSSFIQRFIINNPSPSSATYYNVTNSQQDFIDRVLSQRDIHPNIAKGIDLVFTHLANFRIHVYSNETKQDFDTQNVGGVYHNYLHMLIVPGSSEGDPGYEYSTIRALFRTAALQTAHQTFTQAKVISGLPYYPHDDQEFLKFIDMINEGLASISKLERNLKLEEAGELDPSIKQKYDALRDRWRATFLKYYPHTFSQKVQNLNVRQHEIGKPGYIMGSGSVVLKDIINLPDNYQRLTFVAQDPLWAAAEIISSIFKTAKKEHSHAETLSTALDQAIQARIPQEIIEYFFPKYYKYTNDLIANALNTQVAHPIEKLADYNLNQFRNFDELFEYNMITQLTDPKVHIKENVFELFSNAGRAAKSNYLEAAKISMRTFIAHNIEPALANKHLAGLEYQDGNFIASEFHYSEAKKLNASFSEIDEQHFAEVTKAKNSGLTATAQTEPSTSARPQIR